MFFQLEWRDPPRPSDIKRVRKLGWNKRMQLPGGREMIMRNILEDKKYLAEF